VNNVRFFFLLSISIGISFLTGCKSQSPTDSTPKDPAKAVERVSQANQILVPRIGIIVSTGGDSSALNLSSANSLYREALTYDNDNLDAHFGVALTEMLTLFSDPSVSGLGGLGIPFFSAQPVISALKVGGGYQQFPYPSVINDVESIKTLVRPSGAVRSLLAKSQVDHPPSYSQDIVETKVIPVLADAIQHLQRITQNANYAFLITPQLMGTDSGPTYRIDLTEIYLLLAVVQFLDGEALWFASYNIDYSSASEASVTQVWKPSSPFLALRTNGAQHMKDTRSSYVGLATSIKSGINFLMNDPPHKETDVITYNPQDQAQFKSIIQSMDTLIAEFSGPWSTGGVTINPVNFFDTPVTDFKAKLPLYSATARLNSSGKYDAVLTWQAVTFDAWVFPDPTFNGFLPGMTDVHLKQVLGIDGGTWGRTVTIPG
jgi:hypothetical protein